jgi:hypothetical protein
VLLNSLFIVGGINAKVTSKKKKKYVLLRKINGLLKQKLIVFCLKNVMFKSYTYFLNIKIKNIFTQRGLYAGAFIDTKYRKQKYIVQALLIAATFMNSDLLTTYLALLLKTGKNHVLFLKNFIRVVENLFFSNAIKCKGFLLRVAGKLNGKMRRGKYNYRLGKTQLRVLKYRLHYSLGVSYTKFGLISIKI